MHRSSLPELVFPLILLAATPAAAQTPAAPSSGTVEKPELQHIPATTATTVLGRRVVDRAGDEIGRVVDVLVDGSDHPVAAVLDVGGYMGLGSRKVAVDWARLRLAITGDDARVIVDLDGNVITAAPEYKGGAADIPVLTGPAPKQ